MRFACAFIFLLIFASVEAQTDLIISGQTYTNSSDTWAGINIPRANPTKLIFKNNSITSSNRFGYLLQAGDESPVATNNNLDGAVITGNMLTWRGSDMEVIPHGLFTGHNRNVLIKYNYLNYVPMGIIRKSGNNMSNTGGGVAYNIVKGGAVALVIKGMSNVNVFNNTFYTDRTPEQTWRPLLYIYTNTDQGLYSVAHGTKIYNNIFYTKFNTPAITVLDQESLAGLECDYNVYWSESGAPVFVIGNVRMTFAQWQARGYDTHSVVMNPSFRNLTGFVPDKRINNGKDLGTEWAAGLSPGATWSSADPATTLQNGPWQVGAVIHGSEGGETGTFEIIQSVLSGQMPSTIEITFSQPLAQNTPPSGAFAVNINSSPVQVDNVTISGNKILLTFSGTINPADVITVNYSRPSINPVQSLTGQQLESFSGYTVINNQGGTEISIYPNPAKRFFNISNPGNSQPPQIIRIYDLSGKLRFSLESATEFLYRIPIDLATGIYILHIETASGTDHSQKLIVVE